MRVNCLNDECPEFLDIPDQSYPAKYVCARHLLVDPSEAPKFQDHAFDPELKSGRKKEHDLLQLIDLIDGDKITEGRGFQIKNIRSGNERVTPEWARMKEDIQKILLTAFPKLHTNPGQRKRAGLWAQVINLYYLKGWSASEVAEELNENLRMIKWIAVSISRTSKGLTVDGCPRKK